MSVTYAEPQTTTSAISPVVTGSGRNRVTDYTATQVTGPIGNPPKYISEIIRYDDAKGSNPTTIGTRDSNTGNITWNDNATGRIRQNESRYKAASTGQIHSIQGSVANNAPQIAALNSSAGLANQAQGSGNDSATAGTTGSTSTTSAATSAGGGSSSGGAGTGAAGETRTSFPGAGGGSPLVFPEAISNVDRDVIKFNMVEYQPSGFGNADGPSGRSRVTEQNIIGSVMLPVPSGIQDSSNVSWGSGELNPIEMAAASAALSGIQEGIAAGMKKFEGEIKNAANNKEDVKKGLGAVVVSSATNIGKQALQRGEGMVVNPNMELLFGGPTMRDFGFSFKLSPRSQKEAETVVKIIKFFKQGMAPIRSQSNFFLKAPHTFKMEYLLRTGGGDGRLHPYLNKFKECALKSCTVQYTPDGNYNTFSDGVMASYSMQLQFSELEPIFNDDYGSGDFDATIGY